MSFFTFSFDGGAGKDPLFYLPPHLRHPVATSIICGYTVIPPAAREKMNDEFCASLLLSLTFPSIYEELYSRNPVYNGQYPWLDGKIAAIGMKASSNQTFVEDLRMACLAFIVRPYKAVDTWRRRLLGVIGAATGRVPSERIFTNLAVVHLNSFLMYKANDIEFYCSSYGPKIYCWLDRNCRDSPLFTHVQSLMFLKNHAWLRFYKRFVESSYKSSRLFKDHPGVGLQFSNVTKGLQSKMRECHVDTLEALFLRAVAEPRLLETFTTKATPELCDAMMVAESLFSNTVVNHAAFQAIPPDIKNSYIDSLKVSIGIGTTGCNAAVEAYRDAGIEISAEEAQRISNLPPMVTRSSTQYQTQGYSQPVLPPGIPNYSVQVSAPPPPQPAPPVINNSNIDINAMSIAIAAALRNMGLGGQ